MSTFWLRQSVHAKQYLRGTHRTHSPEQTWERFSPWLSRFGITRLANVTGLDHVGLPVYTAIRPNSRSLSVSQGKALDPLAAKVGAMMEAIELWHAENIDLPMRWEPVRRLKRRANVIDIQSTLREPGHPLDENVATAWVQGWDLVDHQPSWVPLEAVSMDFVCPPGIRSPFVRSSNGLASGNQPIEAIVHAIYEVVERDALAQWTRKVDAGGDRSLIDLRTVDHPDLLSALQLLDHAGLTAFCWDITSPLGIPAFACRIYEMAEAGRWRALGAYAGFGCHLSPFIALQRAVTEAAQSRLTYITGSRDDIPAHDYRTSVQADALRAEVELLSSLPRTPFVFRDLATETFEGDLDLVLARLRSAGYDSPVAVDLTRPELGIPVVKVLAPGLEGAEHGRRVPSPHRRHRNAGGRGARG